VESFILDVAASGAEFVPTRQGKSGGFV